MSLGSDIVKTDDSKSVVEQSMTTPRIFTDEFRVVLKEMARNKSAESFNAENLLALNKKLKQLFIDHNIDSLDLAIHVNKLNINDHLGTIARCLQGTPVSSVSIDAIASKPLHETQIRAFALNLANTAVKHINISYCPIGSRGVIAFLEALGETKNHMVESLNISKCGLTDRHHEIASLIKKLKLKTLQIHLVDFDMKAQQCLLDELAGTSVRVFITDTQKEGKGSGYVLNTRTYELVLSQPELPDVYTMVIDDSASLKKNEVNVADKKGKTLTPQYAAQATNTSDQSSVTEKNRVRNGLFMTHMRKKSMHQ